MNPNPMPRSERGKLGNLRRWGPPRRLQIGDLTPDQRRLVLALIEAQRTANVALKIDADAPDAA